MINLNLKKSLFIPIFFPYLADYSHRWEFLMGGAGSGKSYSITQKIIVRCCSEKIRFVVCRRYATTLRNSCFALFKEILEKWQISQYVKIKETDMSITFPNGSQIIMLGLDEETKLLSLANISGVWIEEAYEVEKEKVEQLNLRMRGKADNQQIILSWNPISQDSWLYDFSVVNPPNNSIFIHSTFEDNPFLSQEYKDTIRELKDRNPAKWRIYGLGEWGINEEGLVFKNWREEDFDVKELLDAGFERRCGSDIGYIDPTTIISSFYDRANNRIYVHSEFYGAGLQLNQVQPELERVAGRRIKVYMDAAEPRTIEYFRQQGFNTVPCLKGQGSVQSRISFLQNNELIIHPSCYNLINELKNFSYILDKKTNKFTEKTTHEYSHCIDALGYAYSDIYQNNNFFTFDKKLLGL